MPMIPIRPVRVTRTYEEHIELQKFTYAKKNRRQQQRLSAQTQQEQHTQQKQHTQPQPQQQPQPASPSTMEAEINAVQKFAHLLVLILKAASKLKGQVNELDPRAGGSVLERRLAYSSEPQQLRAYADAGAETGKHQIRVRQLAASQLNCSAHFKPEAPTSMQEGINRIGVAIGGDSYELELFVSRQDTHQKVLNNLLHLFSQKLPHIRATIQTDSSNLRIRLLLESTESGTAHAYRLRDLEGNAAAVTGLRVIDRLAADAEYKLNDGGWEKSASNSIYIPQLKLGLDLLQVAASPIVVTIAPDFPYIRQRLQHLNQSIEQLQQQLAESAQLLNPAFTRTLAGIVEQFTPAFLAEQLEQQYPKLLSNLTAEDGLISRLQQFIAHMEAGSAEELLNRDNSRYKRYANYLSSLDWYSQLPSQGLLLNHFY